MAAKILTLDIETAPIEALVWGIWDETIGLNQIMKDWSVLSYSAKWLDESALFYKDTGGRGPKRVRDDKQVLREIHKLLDEADIVVAQNGKKFDVRKINARLIQQGFGPYSPIRVVDTTEVAKKVFGFTSNKLAWQAEILTDTPKDEHKEFPGMELWIECLKDNPRAWKEMAKYNKRDVVATEKLYLRQRPWINGHPNLAVYYDSVEARCPKCGSEDFEYRGYLATQVSRFRQILCHTCKGWSRLRVNELGKEKRKALMAN